MPATQKVCSVHGAKHLFVFVGERNGADWFRCACMNEMRNAREALEPDSDFTIADVACEAEAAALLGDDAVQAAVLLRQLEASLCHTDEEDDDHHIASAAEMPVEDFAAHDAKFYDDPSEGLTDAY